MTSTLLILAMAAGSCTGAPDLEQKIATYALLDALECDRDTMEGLLDVAARARDLMAAYRGDLSSLRREQIDAFTAFREEDFRNEGFTEEVEGRTGQTDHQETALKLRLCERVRALEGALREVLSDAQQATLENPPTTHALMQRYLTYRFGPGEVDPTLRNIVDRARRMDDAEFRRQALTLIDQAIAVLPYTVPEGEDPRSYRETVAVALIQLRTVDEANLDDEILRRVRDLRPRAELERVMDELGAIHRQRHGELSNTGAFLIRDDLVGAIAHRLRVEPPEPSMPDEPHTVTASACPCEPCGCNPCTCCGDVDEDIRRLRTEINLLNLMNGLNLSTHQLAHIYVASRREEQIRQWNDSRVVPPRDSAVAEYRRRLEAILHGIEAGTALGPADIQRAEQARGPATCSTQTSPRSDLPAPEATEEDDLARAIREILFASQLQVIADYNPCLIPTQNLRDPVRVGQAHDTSGTVTMLERIRAIPAERWQANRDGIIEDTMREAEQSGGQIPARERQDRSRRLAEALDRVRSMSDIDFELGKDQLAEELAFLNREEELKRRLVELQGGSEEASLQKIRQFLMDPAISPIVRDRVRDLRRRADPAQTDLDTISPAPGCRDGHCAVDD